MTPDNELDEGRLLTFSEAAKYIGRRFPGRRGGRGPNVSTLHRWASRGIRGIRLEVVSVGGTRAVTVAALNRFFGRLAGRDPARDSATVPAPAAGRANRDRRVAAAEKALSRAGI